MAMFNPLTAHVHHHSYVLFLVFLVICLLHVDHCYSHVSSGENKSSITSTVAFQVLYLYCIIV